MRRISTSLLLAALVLLASASPALAHSKLISSDPAEGASLPAAPQQLQLTFNEPVQARSGKVTITGPDGSQWSVGTLAVRNTVLTAPVQPVGPAGQYTISYRVISADGDPVSGTVRFTLTNPVIAPTTAPPITTTASQQPSETSQPTQSAPVQQAGTTNDDDGMPVWPWILGAIVVLGIGLAIALRFRRSAGSNQA